MTDPARSGTPSKRGLSRRRLLGGLAGAAGAASLAGCTFTSGALDSSMEAVMAIDELTMFKGAPARGEYPAATSHVEHAMPGGHMEMDAVTVGMTAATDDSNNYHFMPHVAWIEPGQTVFWEHFARDGVSERRTHTVTSFGGTDLFLRLIPDGASHFDSGYRAGTHGVDQDELIDERFNRGMAERIGQEGGFSHTFEREGVYLYYCQSHHQYKMAGAVVVGELWGEHGDEAVSDPDGWAPAMTADIESIVDSDPMHGEAVHDQVLELRELIRGGGAGMGGGHGGDGGGH